MGGGGVGGQRDICSSEQMANVQASLSSRDNTNPRRQDNLQHER
jgi:hypothetical protein